MTAQPVAGLGMEAIPACYVLANQGLGSDAIPACNAVKTFAIKGSAKAQK